MIKGVVFDCFGVLTTDSWKEFVANLPVDKQRTASALNRAYGSAFLNHDEFVKAVEELSGSKPQDINELLDNEITKNKELFRYIKTLRPKYKIGLLSNVATNWIRERFLSEEEQKLFDSFTMSYEVHLAKPDPRVFTIAAERLNLLPEECVLVDDVDYYCEAANSVGMKTICYENFQQTKQELQKLLKA